MNNFVINGATTTTADLHADDKVTNDFDSAMEYSSSTTTNNSSLATEQVGSLLMYFNYVFKELHYQTRKIKLQNNRESF